MCATGSDFSLCMHMCCRTQYDFQRVSVWPQSFHDVWWFQQPVRLKMKWEDLLNFGNKLHSPHHPSTVMFLSEDIMCRSVTATRLRITGHIECDSNNEFSTMQMFMFAKLHSCLRLHIFIISRISWMQKHLALAFCRCWRKC